MEYQTFNGIQFYQTTPKDYFKHSVGHTTILMHKYVWEYYNGLIPKGYDIHHIDRNRANNDISNLQLLTKQEHKELHAELLTPEEREWRRTNVVRNAVPKAIEWHKSDEGKQWHRQQAKTRSDNRTYRTLVCTHCGKSFTVFSNKDSKFCSNKCKTAYSRAFNRNKEERECIICGSKFLTDKYKKAVCCSPACRTIYGHQNRQT